MSESVTPEAGNVYGQRLLFGEMCREYGSRHVVTLLCDLFGKEVVVDGLEDMIGSTAVPAASIVAIYLHNRPDDNTYGLRERKSFFQ